MAFTVTSAQQMNATFAAAFNSRRVVNLLSLYEPAAILRTVGTTTDLTGLDAIEQALTRLLQMPGRMSSHNHFCIVNGDLALLRADWQLSADDGTTIASGSSVELLRKQADGRWLYVIDHATGAGLPRIPAAGRTG